MKENNTQILEAYLFSFVSLEINKLTTYTRVFKMELFEEEIEIYNSKMRLLNWLYDEIKLQSDISKDFLNEKGQKLPLNI